MCCAIISDMSKATYSAALPASYRMALDKLTEDTTHPQLSSLSDESVLALAKEILSNFYDKKDEWASIDNWARDEVELLQLSGSAAELSHAAAPYNLASSLGVYLCTFAEALEHKLGESKKLPQLLLKKRQVMDAEVYGPVGLGLPGNTFEVWTTPAAEDSYDEAKEGEEQKEEECGLDKKGKIAVVLGAGNQSMLTLIDIVDNVLRHRRPVLAKHHPLRNWLSKPYGIILEPLIQRGYLAQVPDISNGVTTALLADPSVGHVHITGSLKTSQAVHEILRNANPGLTSNEIKSMITSELGCVTPQIMDDGVYTEKEIQHACQSIVFGKKANGGCNCLSAQVIILPKYWGQKDIFRAKLFEELKRQPTTPLYYPGSAERKSSILEKCQQAGSKCITTVAPPISEEINVSDADQVVVVECGTPGEEGFNPEPLLAEAFGPILAIVELDSASGSDDDHYLARTAVPFLNNKDNIFGSLSCSLFTPVSKGKTYDRQDLQSALSALQYGAICINQVNLLGYLTAVKGGRWGAHKLEKLGQSGNGLIGDQYGIIGNKVAKSVVYGPSLDKKPMFDLASMPPAIVLDVLMEFACSPSIFSGMMKALKLVATKSVYGIVSYLPGFGLLSRKRLSV